MKFEYRERVTYPVDEVYSVLRDRLLELPPFLDGVDEIVMLEREELDDDRLRILNEWRGNAKSAPKAVRPFVNRAMTTWLDHALWDDAQRTVTWRFETNHFETLYECSGVNYFEEGDNGHTVIRLTGELRVYPERVPGVPRLLAKRLAPTVEEFLIGMVTPNLANMPRAIQSFLDQGSSS